MYACEPVVNLSAMSLLDCRSSQFKQNAEPLVISAYFYGGSPGISLEEMSHNVYGKSSFHTANSLRETDIFTLLYAWVILRSTLSRSE